MPSSLLRHRPHRAWSGTGTFYAGEVGIPYGGWCNGADFTEIPKFPEILGELSMRKQCVPASFLSAHALEPGNEASYSGWLNCWFFLLFPEIDMEGTIAPDTDPPQQMGDPNIEVCICMLCYDYTMFEFGWLLCC